ncbi:MAG: PRC-barrel domain-containing protein [Tranquillimonas sp.]
MKRLMTTAAMALVIGTGAYAQSNQSDQNTFIDYSAQQTGAQDQLLASDFMGARIYATEQQIDANAQVQPDAKNQWEDIGEVNDIVLGQQGNVDAVIVGVGGFLGIGERDVALSMDQIKIVRDGEGADDYFLVVNATRQQIENAPEYQRPSAGQQAADAGNAAATGAAATATAAGGTVAAGAGASNQATAGDQATMPKDQTAMTSDSSEMPKDQMQEDQTAMKTDQSDMPKDQMQKDQTAMSSDTSDMPKDQAAQPADTSATASATASQGDTTVAAENSAGAAELGSNTDMAAGDTSSREEVPNVVANADANAAGTATNGPTNNDTVAQEQSQQQMEQNQQAAEQTQPLDQAQPQNQQIAAGDRTVLTPPAVERDGYTQANISEISTDELDGTRVYGANDQSVGEIDKLLLNDQGQVERVVINVGGFLGLGEKPIAVTFDELTLLKQQDGNDIRVYIDSTENALESQPRYQEQN